MTNQTDMREKERRSFMEKSELEKLFHSNSLLVLNAQNERIISLIRQLNKE
jgi:hypothetical protein